MGGVLLAVVLSGPVEALHRWKVPRSVSSVSILVSTLGVLALGGYLLLPSLAEQVTQLALNLPEALSWINEQLQRLANTFGVSLGDGPSLSTVSSWAGSVMGGVFGLFGSLWHVVLGLVVVLFVSLYLSANPLPAVEWTVRFFPPDRRSRVREVLPKIRSGLLNWLMGRLLSMAVTGILWIIILYAIGIPGALLLSVFAGLAEFVPYLGPIIAVIPPALVGLTGDPSDALWVLGAYAVMQGVESYLLAPLVEGRATSLHPAVVVAVLALAGSAFGFLGILLSVPAIVVAKILIEELWFRRLEGDHRAQEETD